MKRLILLVLGFTMVLSSAAYADDGVRLVIDDEVINSSQEPVIINDSTYVPLRLIAEKLGCIIDWNPDTKTVTITSKSGNSQVQTAQPEPAADDTQTTSSEIQSLGSLYTELDDNGDLKLSVEPDKYNDYSKTSETLNVYLYNRNGKLIYEEKNKNVSVANNGDYIDYTIKTRDITGDTEDYEFTSYSCTKVKLELCVNGDVKASSEYDIEVHYNYTVSNYINSGLTINLTNVENTVDTLGKLNARFRIYGDCTNQYGSPDIYILCSDIRGNEVKRVSLGRVFTKGDFDYEQTFEIPLSTASIKLVSK